MKRVKEEEVEEVKEEKEDVEVEVYLERDTSFTHRNT